MPEAEHVRQLVQERGTPRGRAVLEPGIEVVALHVEDHLAGDVDAVAGVPDRHGDAEASIEVTQRQA